MFVSCFVRRSQAERSDIVFAIHCGVAASRTNVSIEQFARNGPYKSDDVAGKQPAGNMCVDGGPDQIDFCPGLHDICMPRAAPALHPPPPPAKTTQISKMDP